MWIVTIVLSQLTYLSPSGYRPGIRICYTKAVNGQPNPLNWVFLYIWIVLYWFISVCLVFACIRNLISSNFEKTFETRIKTIRKGLTTVVFFTIVRT